MNHLLAKVRDRKEKYRKLMSDKEIYRKPDTLEGAIEYSPAYKLEEDQWYKVSDFSQKDFCIDLLKSDIDSTEYRLANTVSPEKMDYICSYQSENEFYFQRVYKSNMLERKRFLDIGDNIQLKEARNILILSDFPDALYIKDEDCLYFKKLEVISPIFRGIEKLYRMATQAEVEGFLNESFIKIGESYGLDKVGKANRHRLAMAMDTLKLLDEKQKKEIFSYTDKYYPNLNYNGNSFEIKNEEDLKNLLFGIEQRFYTTPVTNEKRVANSVSLI